MICIYAASCVFGDVLSVCNCGFDLIFFFICILFVFFFFQAEDGIRDRSPSRGLGDVYKRQPKEAYFSCL